MDTEKEEYGNTVLPEIKTCLKATTLRMAWCGSSQEISRQTNEKEHRAQK